MVPGTETGCTGVERHGCKREGRIKSSFLSMSRAWAILVEISPGLGMWICSYKHINNHKTMSIQYMIMPERMDKVRRKERTSIKESNVNSL